MDHWGMYKATYSELQDQRIILISKQDLNYVKMEIGIYRARCFTNCR